MLWELESEHMGELWDLFLTSRIHSVTFGIVNPILFWAFKTPKKEKKEKIIF